MSDQCGSVITKNKQNWIRSKGGCCSLKHNFLIRHFSFSLENKDKTPGLETNPPLHNYMYPYNFNFSMDHANEKGVSSS